MSRALSSAVLSFVALIAAGEAAQADFRGRAPLGQGAFHTPHAKPFHAPARHVGRRLPVVAPVGLFYSEPVWRTEQTIIQVIQQEPRQRPLRMRSGNPIEPGATISRTPSGRIFVGTPAGVLAAGSLPEAQPYAPPEFHMIGAPAARHMGAPVRLTHGIKPPETLRTGPKVVWLDEAGRRIDDDAGGRIKRLR